MVYCIVAVKCFVIAGLSLDSNGTVDGIVTVERLWYPDGRFLEREDLEANNTFANG